MHEINAGDGLSVHGLQDKKKAADVGVRCRYKCRKAVSYFLKKRL